MHLLSGRSLAPGVLRLRRELHAAEQPEPGDRGDGRAPGVLGRGSRVSPAAKDHSEFLGHTEFASGFDKRQYFLNYFGSYQTFR